MAEYEVPEKTESQRERVVGLIIAAIAVVLAIVSALSHATSNEQILAHVDASDQYAFYQAKKDRSFALDLAMDNIRLHGGPATPGGPAAQMIADYQAQQTRLKTEGKDIEAKGQAFMDDALRLGRKSQVLDVGEIALQISIVLCSITILTEQRLFAIMGVITAAIGLIVALWGILTG
jgi:hypothetical protein